MVNALLPRGLDRHASRLGDFLTARFFGQRSVRRTLTVSGVLAAGVGVFCVIALGLPSAPQSQTVSGLAPALDQSAGALFEPLTFADRFAADVKDLPPTIGVSAPLSDDPLAVRLAEYRAVLDGASKEPVSAEVPPAQPRLPSETTGARP
jgi:hypothetical protein